MPTAAKRLDLHQLVMKRGRLIARAKGQVVQTTDAQKSLNLVKSGYVKRYLIKNDGSLGVDLIYGPGDVFSLTLVFKSIFNQKILDSQEVYYYQAVTDVDLYVLSTDELVELIKKDPLLYKDLLNEAGKRMTSATQGLENMSMKSSYKRVAHQLAYYARRFGRKTPAGVMIIPVLTHQDIADILSLTRETVSVCMMRLRRKKLIKTNTNILIPDLDKLTEEAYS